MLLFLFTFGYSGGRRIAPIQYSPPPFLCLPREIRDLIYQHVFETDSRFVSSKPHPATDSAQLRLYEHSIENPTSRQAHIDLSLLQVCKDIHQECKDFIWRRKTVVLGPADACVRSKCFQNVRHARLQLDLGCGTYPQWTRECFVYLEKWAKAGALRTLEINVVHGLENLLCIAEVREADKIAFVSCRNIHRREVVGRWEEYMVILREFGNNAAVLKLGQVVTRISVDVGWNEPRFTRLQQVNLLQLAGSENVQGILRDVHMAFGGELWQDGELCWKDNVQVAEAFQLKSVGKDLI